MSASLAAGSKTVTVRLSSRLRPLSWLWAESSGAAVAAMSWMSWCRLGWLSLTWTIREMLPSAATSKCFFDSALHRA